MHIEIWDTGPGTIDRYEAIIDGHVYLMSHDADMPNGVCTYYGRHTAKHDEWLRLSGRPLMPAETPDGVKRAVEFRKGA